jgi:SPASM domain peptide maturase of grasp-with-spasm system
MNERSYFRLFASCIPVRGAKRSTICDLERNRFWLIPDALYEILTRYKKFTIPELKAAFENNYDAFIDEYLAFLQKEELGTWFTKEELKLFPPLQPMQDIPGAITNAIIDIDASSAHPYEKIFEELNQLGCRHIQLRAYGKIDIPALTRSLACTKQYFIKSLHCILQYHEDSSKAALLELFNAYPFIGFDFHSVPESKKAALEKEYEQYPFTFHTTAISDHTHCGKISMAYFTPNVPHFLEAQQFNTCLNRKISVDCEGYIRNCPSMPQHYGHISSHSLAEAAALDAFQQLWQVKKDQVKVCSDCEFRYICTDCRAFVQDASDPFSKPAKCNYNPYTATWEA